MALLDLSLVTRTLVDLIDLSVRASPAWNTANLLEVAPLPPDKLAGDRTLGFYLYHMLEESQGKNTYIPGVSDAPVRYAPLSLNLFYLLTAHSDLDDANSAYQEQLMMGLAMKALHDHPLITDETAVDGIRVMAPELRGTNNRLRVSLTPVRPDDAVSYWMAGSAPLRLAAYYQVSVVQLEPEDPLTRAGRVLAYGVHVAPSATPRVDATENLLSITLPGESEPRLLEVRPAQVTYGQTFSVVGSGFAGAARLLVRRAGWSEAVTADPAWGVVISSSRVRATVQPTASGVDILPGIYTAAVQVQQTLATPAGPRTTEQTSNETPFAVAPRIDSVSVPDGAGRCEVIGAVFAHPALAAGAIQLFVGVARLATGDANNLQPGEFGVIDANTLRVRLPAGTAPGSVLSLRLIVAGAESAPQWVSAP